MIKKNIFLIAFYLFTSCNNVSMHEKKAFENKKSIINTNILAQSKIDTANVKPIWGYRFQITGDFDDNGKQDTLWEHFYSKRDQKETNKYFSGINDVWVLYDSADVRDCRSYFLSNDPKFDTLFIGGVLGPLWVKNEGDLNKDGVDDLSYVASKPQQSSINHCNIIGFKNGKWKEMYSFQVREWQFPPLPEGGKTYGNWGADGFYNVDDDDTTNAIIQKQFNEFPGLITKLRYGKVKIETFTLEAFDTTLTLDLSKHPKYYN